MPIKIIKKPVAKKEVEDVAALVAMGILPEPDAVVPVAQTFQKGDSIRITNGLFPWVQSYKQGDTGIVSSVVYIARERDLPVIIYKVLLDVPRVDDGLVLISGWEMELLIENIVEQAIGEEVV